MLSHFEIIGLSQAIKNCTISIRKDYGIKLPDSIISATTIESNAILISNDKQLLNINNMNVLKLQDYINNTLR